LSNKLSSGGDQSDLLLLATFLLALFILLFINVPVDTWKQPTNQISYVGFDPNLINIKRAGSVIDSTVDLTSDTLRLRTSHNSRLDVNLFTFSYDADFRVEFNVRIFENFQVSEPLDIILWNVRDDVRAVLTFTSSPENAITAKLMSRGNIIEDKKAGEYTRGRLYHVEVIRHKEDGEIVFRLSPRDLESPTPDENLLLLLGGPNEPAYYEIASELIPVKALEKYVFGGKMKLLFGDGWYKFVIDWLDEKGQKLSSSNDWRLLEKKNTWVLTEFGGVAPNNASFAQIRLGAGNGRTLLLLTDVFLRESKSGVNLIANSKFIGSKGWIIAYQEGKGSLKSLPTISYEREILYTIKKEQAPTLFTALPLSLTLSTFSTTGTTDVYIDGFKINVPSSERLIAVKVEDVTSTTLIIVFTVVGSLLFLLRVVIWLKSGGFLMLSNWLNRPFLIEKRKMVIIIILIFLYVSFNALLFQTGNHFYDFTSFKLYLYIAARYGCASLYHLSSIAPLPHHITGEPVASPTFPYGPTMTYVFGIMGRLTDTLLPASQLRLDNFLFDFIIKGTNVIFGLLCGILIYSILFKFGNEREGLIAFVIFLFNPAIWFMMSIWGETHTISMFFILLSIWFACNRFLGLAWATLVLTVFTRPQMTIPALLLGLIYTKSFTIRRTLQGLSSGIVLSFAGFSPLLFALSPSLPMDVLFHTTKTYNLTDSLVTRYLFLSNDAYNLWPLLTRFTLNLIGPSRIFVPKQTSFFGSLTYLDVSNILQLLLLAFLVYTILRYCKGLNGKSLGVVAAGFLALTMAGTGISSHHFTLTIPLILLAKKSLGKYAYYSILFFLTVTTFLTMWGSMLAALEPMSLLYPYGAINNYVSRFIAELYVSDRFITLGTLLNTISLFWLTIKSIHNLRIEFRSDLEKGSL